MNRIPPPKPPPTEIYNGLHSLWAKTGMTANEFREFTNLVENTSDKYLSPRGSIINQGRQMLTKHYAEVAKLWHHEDKYKDDWPVRLYTKLYLASDDWRTRPEKMSTKKRRKSRAPSIYNRSPSPVQSPPPQRGRRPSPAPATRRRRAVSYVGEPVQAAPQARRPAPERRAASRPPAERQARPFTRAVSRASARPVPAAAASLHPGPAVSRAGSPDIVVRPPAQPAAPRAGPRVAVLRPRDRDLVAGAAAVHAFFSMEPPFLSVETVDDLIELGVVNMDRLRDLASLSDRSMWINRYVELSRLEYWILKRKLDKLAPGL